MRYLCKLVTPPNGIVLDPFMGSGSTGIGAILENFDFLGIEREPDYFEIARERIRAALIGQGKPDEAEKLQRRASDSSGNALPRYVSPSAFDSAEPGTEGPPARLTGLGGPNPSKGEALPRGAEGGFAGSLFPV